MAGMDDPQMNLSDRSGSAHSASHDHGGHHDTSRNLRAVRPTGTQGAGPYFRDTRKSRLTLLSQAIETAVIPRLVAAHRAPAQALQIDGPARLEPCAITASARSNWFPQAAELRAFVALLMDRDDTLAPLHIEALVADGIAIEAIYCEMFGPAARMLGCLWEQDETDFSIVTSATIRLHRMLHLLDERFTGPAPLVLPTKRILLMPAIGEQHGFGLAMVAQYFRRARWDVTSEQPTTNGQLSALVRASWFDVVGFSSSLEQSLPQLATSVQATRKASRNPHLRIMVGGSVFVAQPGRYRETGADATAADAAQAVIEAEALISLLARTG